jgi:hypothetical protein
MVRPGSESVAEQVCDEFVARFGISELRPEPISFRQNAIFYLANVGISLRIYGPGEDPGRAAVMVNCGRWLESLKFPAVRCAKNVFRWNTVLCLR